MAKRVDWTTEEIEKVINGIKGLIEQRRIKVPLVQPWGRPSLMIGLAKEAQIVLSDARRRPIRASESLRGLMPDLVKLGIIKPEDSAPWDVETPVKQLSKDELRIQQLADERDAAILAQATAEQERDAAKKEIHALRNQLAAVPPEMEVIKRFVADVMGRAMKQAQTGISLTMGDDLNAAQAREMKRLAEEAAAKAAAKAERERLEREAEERNRKPLRPVVLVVVGAEEPTNSVPKWQEQFPGIELRELRAREDGRLLNVPRDAVRAILIQGIRHATSAEVREVYAGAPLAARVEAPNILRTWHQQLARK